MNKFTLQCVKCGRVQSCAYSPRCEHCDHLTEVRYDLARARLTESENPYDRFFDLLPVSDRTLLPASCSYTPTVHARVLGERLGLPFLYLKNETVHPSGTTMYSKAGIALAYLYEAGVRHFCTSSTGNSSTGYALQIQNVPGMRMSLFTGSEFLSRVYCPPDAQVDHYVLEGASFAEAFNYAQIFSAKHGYTAERGFFNPGRREGLKLAWCEASDQVNRSIDWYVQAVSSGMGVYGTYKAAQELMQLGYIKRLPRLLCVQQDSCAPMVRAWNDGSPIIRPDHIVAHPQGIAKAILRGDPSGVYPYMRDTVQRSNGNFEAVTEGEILEAQALVAELEGVSICPSAATAVAGLIKMRRGQQVATGETVLINLTGSDRDSSNPTKPYTRLVRAGNEWVPQHAQS